MIAQLGQFLQTTETKREARRRLPKIFADLFDEPFGHELIHEKPDRGVDLVVDAGGRRWAVEAKGSSSPGIIAAAAHQLAALKDREAAAVLVVPYMTPAGAKAAAERGLNWIDLSGNAHLRDDDLYISVHGHPNEFAGPGRPSSPFAPKSSRVARTLLLDPGRWWLQKELSAYTDLDPSQVSRVARRFDDDHLLEREGARLRPRDPDLLLDAWADDYRFDRHDILMGHLSGGGVELAREVHDRLYDADVQHAFTGLTAAWAIQRFARFRLNSIYVTGDPRESADIVGLRRNARGANVQLLGPDDRGVFDGQRTIDDLPCVSPVQVYLDLAHLPERAAEAAEHLHTNGKLWDADA